MIYLETILNKKILNYFILLFVVFILCLGSVSAMNNDTINSDNKLENRSYNDDVELNILSSNEDGNEPIRSNDDVELNILSSNEDGNEPIRFNDDVELNILSSNEDGNEPLRSSQTIYIDDTWNSNGVNTLFNTNFAMGHALNDGDTVFFNTTSIDTFNNIRFTVNKKVTILGNGIKFIGSGTGITLNSNNITIDNISFRGYTTTITNSLAFENITIQNSKFFESASAIRLNKLTNLNIINNTISKTSGVGIGIQVVNSKKFNITNNTVSDHYNYGIVVQNSDDFNVSNNIVKSFKIRGDYGDTEVKNGNHYGILMSNGTNSNIFNNYVESFYESIVNNVGSNHVNVYNNNVNKCLWGIKFSDAYNGYIYNNTVKNAQRVRTGWFAYTNGNGISLLRNAENITIENNTFNDNVGIGISVKETKNINVINNSIYNNGEMGINLESTFTGNALIENNTIFNNTSQGIQSDSNAKTKVINNNITGNTAGITITNGNEILISNNTIHENLGNGIGVTRGSNINITNNDLYKNSNGMILRQGNNYIIEKNNVTNSNDIGIALGYSNYKINNAVVRFNNISFNLGNGIQIFGNQNNITNNLITKNGGNGLTVNGENNYLAELNITNNTKSGVLFHNVNNFKNGNNILNRSNILYNGGNGIIMESDKNSVLSSTILGNIKSGFYVSGNNNTLNYNRIYKNNLTNSSGLVNTGNNTNANLNWWGVNNATSQVTNTGNNLTFDYWYVLELSADDFKTIVNDSLDFSDKFEAVLGYKLSTNNNTSHNPELLPYFTVKVIGPNNETITGDIRNTTVNFNAEGNNDNVSIRSLSDDEDVLLKVFLSKRIPNFTINKTANNNLINFGESINYTITIVNNGTGNASSVKVVDVLGHGLKFVSASNGGIYDITTRTITWTIDLAINSTKILNVIAIASGYGTLTNTVSIDNKTSEVNVTVSKVVEKTCNLSITKVINKNKAIIGSIVTYKITVKNFGPDDAENVYVIEMLPKELVYKSHSLTKGTFDLNVGKWNIGKLANGESVTLIISVLVTKVGNFTNNVTVHTSTNNTGFNNSSNATVNVFDKDKPEEPENKNKTQKISLAKTGILSEPTGNPLILLLISIVILVIGKRRKY